MNPRRRRALIPGLLIALLVVVVVAAIANQARAGEQDPRAHRVSTITDPRVPESSGLAVSTSNPAWAYTINDSGNAPVVYTIKISTGEVVGTTRLIGYDIVDTEALAVGRDGMLWVADTGDNTGVRHVVALYALDEPGRGDTSVRPTRYLVRYGNGRPDVEALLADPHSGAVFVVSKGFLGGQVYRLPASPSRDHANVLTPVRGVTMPVLVTGGAFLPDGAAVIVRNYISAYAYDPTTWERLWMMPLPHQRQGESLAVEPDGQSLLIGTEGLPSSIVRVALPEPQRVDLRSRRAAAAAIADLWGRLPFVTAAA